LEAFVLTQKRLNDNIQYLDDDSGFLVKESTLKRLIEKIVNEDRITRQNTIEPANIEVQQLKAQNTDNQQPSSVIAQHAVKFTSELKLSPEEDAAVWMFTRWIEQQPCKLQDTDEAQKTPTNSQNDAIALLAEVLDAHRGQNVGAWFWSNIDRVKAVLAQQHPNNAIVPSACPQYFIGARCGIGFNKDCGRVPCSVQRHQ